MYEGVVDVVVEDSFYNHFCLNKCSSFRSASE